MSLKVRTNAHGLRELAVSNEPWTSALRERYIAEQCNALTLAALGRDFSFTDIGFVGELPGLRGLLVLGNVDDDTAAFDLDGLQAINLLGSSCRRPVRLGRLRGTEVVRLPYRPNIEELASLEAVRSLALAEWPSIGLASIGDKPHLVDLSIDFRSRASVDSTGMGDMPSLRELDFEGGRIVNVQGLASLRALERINMRNTKLESLNFLRDMSRLSQLNLVNCGSVFESLAPLEGCENLEGLHLFPSEIADGDLSVLFRLPRLRFVGIRHRPSYSHTKDDLRRAFVTSGAYFPDRTKRRA